MDIVHLTSSRFFGGPEKQILQLAVQGRQLWNSWLLSYAEKGLAWPFIDKVRQAGCRGQMLRHDTPRALAMAAELTRFLKEKAIDVLCTHGYKANVIGLRAARRAGIPVLAVSRGWTAENCRVRFWEAVERLVLPRFDTVVCVSQAQARRVEAAGVPAPRITVIANAVELPKRPPAERYRRGLVEIAGGEGPIVCAAGRLSPEKGFDVLIDAARRVVEQVPAARFVIFGEGVLRPVLQDRIDCLGLNGRVVLAGHRSDFGDYLPWCDLFVLSSHTEGMPNVLLESFAAGVPVVATAVGGVEEIVEEGRSGFLVPPGSPARLARGIVEALASPGRRKALGARGQQRVRQQFTFEQQVHRYWELFDRLLRERMESSAVRRAWRISGLLGTLRRKAVTRS